MLTPWKVRSKMPAMPTTMLKQDVLDHFGGNQAAVARAITEARGGPYTRAAVGLWGEHVPELACLLLLKYDPSLCELVIDSETGLSLREMRRRAVLAEHHARGDVAAGATPPTKARRRSSSPLPHGSGLDKGAKTAKTVARK